MTKTTKVAISIPTDTLRRLDREAKSLDVSRSAAVTRAVQRWLAAMEMDEAEQRYVEGYLRTPEKLSSDVAEAAVTQWEPWE